MYSIGRNAMNPSTLPDRALNASELFNQRVLNDPSTSKWVREQWGNLSKRDVVDALNDLEILQLMLTNKLYGLSQ